MFTNKEKKLIFILSALQFNHIVDFMIIMPLGPQLMRLFQIAPQQFSLLVSSYTFFAGISGILASFYTDRFDRKKSLVLMFAGFTLATLFCAFSPNYETLLIARALTGFFGGVMNSMVLSIVSDVIEYERRGTAMGYLATAFSVASIVGVPLSLFLAQHYNWQSPFLFLALMCVMILFGVIKYIPKIDTHLHKKELHEPFWHPVWTIIKNPTQMTALVFMFFVMFSHFAVIPFLSPSLVANAGLKESELTYIYLSGGLASILTAPLIGRLSDKYGKIKVFVGSILFSTIPIYLITHQGPAPIWVVFSVSAIFFISAGTRMIPAQALISSAVSTHKRGAFMSLLSCIQSMSMALGSFVAGHIIIKNEVTGHLDRYSYVGYMAIIVGLFTLIILQKIKYLDHKHEIHHSPLAENE